MSEFDLAVGQEFGPVLGRVLVRDLVLDALGGRTAAAALRDGERPAIVWRALCRAEQVPEARWHGRGRPEPRRRAS